MTSKPERFDPELAPDGVEIKFFSQWQSRPMLSAPARLIVVHTNAASREGSVDSASAWSERNVGSTSSYTIPHYQVDRSGRARKILPTNRRGIANSTGTSVRDGHGNVSGWSLAIETGDTGTIDDPSISAFTAAQAEMIALIVAYESQVPDVAIPLQLPEQWFDAGVASHTDPFPYPYYTTVPGKTCPGPKKKDQVRDLIIPRAIEIRDAWLKPAQPPAQPPKEDDMTLALGRLSTNPYHYRRGDGNVATILRSNEYVHLVELYKQGKAPVFKHPITGTPITAVDQVPTLNETELDLWVGYVDGSSANDEG